jgi:hypothetical protein
MTRTQLLDEKSRPLIRKLVDKMNLGEYEEISAVRQGDNGWYIEIADRMEEFKAQFKNLKKEVEKETKKK